VEKSETPGIGDAGAGEALQVMHSAYEQPGTALLIAGAGASAGFELALNGVHQPEFGTLQPYLDFHRARRQRTGLGGLAHGNLDLALRGHPDLLEKLTDT
jgi:hypothetical protein